MHTVNASVVSIGLTIFLLIFGAFYTISTGSFITRYRDLMSVYTTPPPGGGAGGATGRGGQPRRGAVAGVKMDDPVWGLSLSTLTESWRSPRSRMKNFRERETTAKGLL